MKHFISLISSILIILCSTNYSYSLTANDILSDQGANLLLADYVNEKCLNGGVINCMRILKNVVDDINNEYNVVDKFTKIKFA